MKKIRLVGPFLKVLVTKPSVISKSLFHSVVKENRKDFVFDQFGFMEGLPELDIMDLFPNFAGKVDLFTHLYGTSLPIDLVVLKLLAQRFEHCDYLEIGTWRGESIANLAPVCRSCVSVSLSDEEMKTLGFSEKFTRVQRLFSRDLPNVKHIEANSMKFDFSRLNQQFDLIFVDGDHHFDAVKNDTQKVFQLLKDENSIIVWHDYVEQYELIDWEVFAGILDGTPADKRNSIYHITNTLMAVYLPGKFQTHTLDFPTVPNKIFEVEIRAKAISSLQNNT